MTCGHRGRFQGVWTVAGVEYPHHLCGVPEIGHCTPVAGHPSLRACVGCPMRTELLPRIDVIVTSHNYGEYLPEALASVFDQAAHVLGKVIVVDDASDPGDAAREVCQRAPAGSVKYLRVDLRSPHLARAAGLAHATARLVHFLDADNILRADYLLEAAKYFLRNTRLAILYPSLQDFGQFDRLREAPESFNLARLESLNFIDTGSVWKREAIEQTGVYRDEPSGWEDWRVAREIMRSGRWDAERHPIPLLYRRHSRQRIARFHRRSYFETAGLADELVTVFTTFSRRIQRSPELWERRKAWLREQTWRRIRLVIANTSHEPLPPGWYEDLPYLEGLNVYEHPVGAAGLEDRNRAAGRGEIEDAVQTAVAAIYNRMWRETATEFVLVLEDDVFPEPLDAIEQLLRGFGTDVAAVSGAYQQRYHPYGWTCWTDVPEDGRPKLPVTAGTGLQHVEGTGFGCLLVRRSQMAGEVIQGHTVTSRYYDVDLWHRLAEQGRGCVVNWSVRCDHAGEIFPPPNTAQDMRPCEHRGQRLRVEKCQICGSQAGPKGTEVPIHACEIHGECAPWRYRAGQGPHSCSSCEEWTQVGALVQLSIPEGASR